MKARVSATVLIVVLLPMWSAGAGKEKGQSVAKGKPGLERKGAAQVTVLFSRHDRELISGWVRERHSSLPPGLAKRDHLPPGLQKQLVRNGTLPPGLEKNVQPLPPELERRLPPLPADYHRVAIGGSVMILNRNTRIVADVLVP